MRLQGRTGQSLPGLGHHPAAAFGLAVGDPGRPNQYSISAATKPRGCPPPSDRHSKGAILPAPWLAWGATSRRSIPAAIPSAERAATATPTVGSSPIWDLQGRYTGSTVWRLALGVRNLFDEDPPFTLQIRVPGWFQSAGCEPARSLDPVNAAFCSTAVRRRPGRESTVRSPTRNVPGFLRRQGRAATPDREKV